MSEDAPQMSYSDRSIYIFFHSNNCKRRVIHLGRPFSDREYVQAETNRMVGEIVLLNEDESTRLANKIRDLNQILAVANRAREREPTEESTEGPIIMLPAEVVEMALREVFAGVRAFDPRQL